jgi:predicted lipoprotein
VHRLLLAELADNVILPTYRAFHAASLALESAAEAHAGSLTVDDLTTLQGAWRQAMTVWQHAEVLQIGPAGSMTTALGGEDRRSEIYSWPTVNACRVDQELTEEAHTDPDIFNEELVNVRGLDAMEYLLFSVLEVNQCKVQSAINSSGGWQELLDSGLLPAKRATYVHTLSVLVEREAKELLEVWESDQTGFLAELTSAGVSSEVYATAHTALNAVSDAMFYVDKQTKDMKLAHPVGISACNEATCPDALESLWAHHSRENVLSNVEALQWLFHGGPDADQALGFDDVLLEMGNPELAADLTVKLTEAVSALSVIELSFVEALSTDPEAVVGVYAAVKSVTDLLKTEFVGMLDLEIPNRAAGDND